MMSKSLQNFLFGAGIGAVSAIMTFLCICLLSLPWIFFAYHYPLLVSPIAILSSILGGAVTGLALTTRPFSSFVLAHGAIAGLLAGLLLVMTGLYEAILTAIGTMLGEQWSFSPSTLKTALSGAVLGMLFGIISGRLTSCFLNAKQEPVPEKRPGWLRFTIFNSLFGALIIMAAVYIALILGMQFR